MNLFSRRLYRLSFSLEQRLKAKAHIILDRVAAGHDVDPALIDWALRKTGDLP